MGEVARVTSGHWDSFVEYASIPQHLAGSIWERPAVLWMKAPTPCN